MTIANNSDHATNPDWSRTYFALACNQLLVIAVLTLFTAAIVRNSRDERARQQIAMPTISETAFLQVGPSGVQAIGGLCAIVIAALVLLRNRLIAVVAASLVFLATVAFLVFALIAAYLPLLVFVKNVKLR